MKNILLLLIASLCCITAIAQPNLTGATINPVVGDQFYGRDQSDTAGISKGPAGAGVTWNFSAFDTTITDTALYIACTTTPFYDSFPGSNVVTFDGTDYNYFATTASEFAYLGVGESASAGGGCVYYPNLQNIIAYPTTYNTVKVDSFYSTQPTFQFYSYGVDSFIADAYGTLILPSGTFTNVLRIHVISYETDSFELTGGFPDVETSRSDIYFWYQPGFHNYLLAMEYDTSGSDTPYLEDAEYYTSGPSVPVDTTSAVVRIANESQLQLYPNPANDQVHIRFNSSNDQAISVSATDILGRSAGQPCEINITPGINDINYNVANLPPGIYLIKIQTADNSYLKKVQVIR